MKKFYLFLDIDGVFNSYKWVKSNKNTKDKIDTNPFHHLNPENVQNLNILLKKLEEVGFQPQIVLSSSWRRGMFSKAVENFKKLNINYSGTYDKTITAKNNEGRGFEIKQYVAKNNIENNFVVIDDEVSDVVEFGINKTNIIKATGVFNDGLTKENINSFIENNLPKIMAEYKQSNDIKTEKEKSK